MFEFGVPGTPLKGWVCVRCGKSNSPWKGQCSCYSVSEWYFPPPLEPYWAPLTPIWLAPVPGLPGRTYPVVG